MPTVLRAGPYRFFFYSADGHEPPHVHISRDRAAAKFWLEPVAFTSATGFNARDLMEIRSLTLANQTLLLKAWHACFDTNR